MKNNLLVALCLVGAGLITGCSNGYDAAINIKNGEKIETLMGSFDGALSLVHGNTKKASIEVTDGDNTCQGLSTHGKYSTNGVRNKIRHQFKITCDDGRTGTVSVTVNARADGGFGGIRANGVGVGQLSDGSKVRVVIGEMSGNLDW